MKHNESLYMFAIMPPEELSQKIHNIREEFSEKFKFRKALKPPVHITLFDPFKIPAELSGTFETYMMRIQKWASFQSPFKINLNNYSFFNDPQHPVVFVDVVKSLPIVKFHSDFMNELAKYKLSSANDRPYKPHVTIGYRDVTREAFPDIIAYYSSQTFSSSFLCSNFYLWKHDGEKWQVVRTYSMDGKSEQLDLF